MNRILVIRGGAIGDFILTLPALKALRDANPNAQIDLLGYKHIAELVNRRFYANHVRSIEYASLASFFTRGGELSPEFADYFATFDLIITFLYDPDLIFENNLRRCGVEEILRGPSKICEHGHAAQQLAEPLEQLGLTVQDFGAHLYPSNEDRETARAFLRDLPSPFIAIHPGSGSETKNWALENWIQLGSELLAADAASGSKHRSLAPSIVVVSGEADLKQITRLESEWRNPRVRFAVNFPLPHLAAVLEKTIFIGHDSGISHLAAASGAHCVLLFGPTDPDVWAPQGDNVQVIRAPKGNLPDLSVETVLEKLDSVL